MTKENLSLILIILSSMLIVLNFIFTSDEMDFGFWMRIVSGILLIITMIITIRDRNKKNKKEAK